jgi:hypothetical protein
VSGGLVGLGGGHCLAGAGVWVGDGVTRWRGKVGGGKQGERGGEKPYEPSLARARQGHERAAWPWPKLVSEVEKGGWTRRCHGASLRG